MLLPGMSLAEINATTPGTAIASEVSMDLQRETRTHKVNTQSWEMIVSDHYSSELNLFMTRES